jgi:hypothetical protein
MTEENVDGIERLNIVCSRVSKTAANNRTQSQYPKMEKRSVNVAGRGTGGKGVTSSASLPSHKAQPNPVKTAAKAIDGKFEPKKYCREC